MYKIIAFVAIISVAFAAPAPEAKAEPKSEASPDLLLSAPVVATAPVAYSAAYSTPLAYPASPIAYGYSAYPAFSVYSSPYLTVL